MRNSFIEYRADEKNPKWDKIIERKNVLYTRNNDIRSEFERDYTRIINIAGFRRMKHKTQVFFYPENDHICTRSEHMTHVESISYTIANYLGLNTELTKAIATAHDLGHSPFGHQGEKVLSEISKKEIGESFWHEKNGLFRVDKIELLEDPEGNKQNLNLTYAVRDGIISHCGEIDENAIKPRKEYINLEDYTYPNQYAPYTWEGCIVKVSDKISYLGRDILDAIKLGIIEKDDKELNKILNNNNKVNNTVIINDLIYDLCMNSSPEKGLCFSEEKYEMIKNLKKYNYKNIYLSEQIKSSEMHIELVVKTIYEKLKDSYKNIIENKKTRSKYIEDFRNWLKDYTKDEREKENKNEIVFNIKDEKEYKKAIISYISGMTDNYAINMFNKIIKFME